MRLWSVLPFLISLDLSWSLFLPFWSFLILQMLTLCGRPSSTPTRCSACNVKQCALETTAWNPKGPWNPLNLNHLNTFALGTAQLGISWYIMPISAFIALCCFLIFFTIYRGRTCKSKFDLCNFNAATLNNVACRFHVDLDFIYIVRKSYVNICII